MAIDFRAGHLALQFSYNRGLVDRVKTLPERQWNNRLKTWFVPVEYLPEVEDMFPLMQTTPAAEDAYQRMMNTVDASKAVSAPSVDPELPGGTLRPYQQAALRYMEAKNGRVLIADDMGLGKQQPVDTWVMTPFGWREIGGLRPGDMVTGSTGHPVRVRGIYPQGVKPIYRVRFSDGSSVEAGYEHLWTVYYRRGGRKWETIVLTTGQLMARPVITRMWPPNRSHRTTTQLDLGKATLYAPMLSAPVEFTWCSGFEIKPYTMGALLANGGLTDGACNISVWGKDAVHIASKLSHLSAKEPRTYGSVTRFFVVGIQASLRKFGLFRLHSGQKFIPRPYLEAPAPYRVELLHGLMDGDGSISQRQNRVTYSTTSSRLADDVQELVEGLGGIASIREYEGDGYSDYQVRIRLPGSIPPFSLPRKLERYHPGKNALPVRVVETVEFSREAEAVCIAVDAPDQLYVTEHCILTHNTVEALAYIHRHPEVLPVVVVCPASVKEQWKRMAMRWLDWPEGAIEVIYGRLPRVLEPRIMYIINYELLDMWVSYLRLVDAHLIVADESHYVKNHKAKRSEQLKSLSEGIITMGLTGTPILNRPSEIWNQVTLIRPDVFPSRYRFGVRYAGVHKTHFGFSGGAATHLEELEERLRANLMIRRTKAQVLYDLPALERVPVPLGVDLTVYRSVANPILKRLRLSRKNGSLDGLTIQDIVAMRQEAATSKLEAVIGWIADFLESGNPLVVYAHHHGVLDEIGAAFDVTPLDGRIPSKVRQDVVDQFAAGELGQLLVCGTRAVAMGTDGLQDAAHYCATVELDWNMAIHDQAESRLHRSGQHDPVVSYYLTAIGTIDEQLMGMLAVKQDDTEGAIGADEPSPRVLELLMKMLTDGEEEDNGSSRVSPEPVQGL